MLNGSLEDNVLMALCYSARCAPVIAAKIAAGDFSTDIYRKIAEKAFGFLEQHRAPPGVHIRDLLEWEIKKGPNARVTADILIEMERLAPQLHEDHVLGGIDVFWLTQQGMALVNKASDEFTAGNVQQGLAVCAEAALLLPPDTLLADPWSEPTPPEFDTAILAPVPVLRAFVEERSRTMGVDPGGLFWSAMSCSSAALDGSIRLRMKEHDEGYTAAGLWVVTIGDVSTGKTPIRAVTWAPLTRLQIKAIRRHNEAMARWLAQDKDDRGPEPVPTRYIANDATVEALQEILIKQHRGIASMQDEWSGWLGQFERYGGRGAASANRSFYIQAYDAAAAIPVDRIAKNRGGIIENPLVIVYGNVQPSVLRELGNLTHDGLMQRAITPFLRPQVRGTDAPGGTEVKDYDALIERLADVDGGLDGERRIVTLSRAALLVREQVEARLLAWTRNNALGLAFRTAAGKWHGQWGRMCLVLGFIIQGNPDEIGVEAAELAETLLFEQVIPHAVRYYSWLGGGAEVATTEAICNWSVATPPRARVTASDISRNVRACHKITARQMSEVVSPLVTMDWLRPEGGAYQANKWTVNPQIYIQFAEKGQQLAVERAQIRTVMEDDFEVRRQEKSADIPQEEATTAADILTDNAAENHPPPAPLARPSSYANSGYGRRREEERRVWQETNAVLKRPGK